MIDTPEYGGPLLYGADGGGFYKDEGVYEWTDEATSLHSKLNNAYGSWAYWSGGAAVSNYHCDIAMVAPIRSFLCLQKLLLTLVITSL